jgi:hypothetical protein
LAGKHRNFGVYVSIPVSVALRWHVYLVSDAIAYHTSVWIRRNVLVILLLLLLLHPCGNLVKRLAYRSNR